MCRQYLVESLRSVFHLSGLTSPLARAWRKRDPKIRSGTLSQDIQGKMPEPQMLHIARRAVESLFANDAEVSRRERRRFCTRLLERRDEREEKSRRMKRNIRSLQQYGGNSTMSVDQSKEGAKRKRSSRSQKTARPSGLTPGLAAPGEDDTSETE